MRTARMMSDAIPSDSGIPFDIGIIREDRIPVYKDRGSLPRPQPTGGPGREGSPGPFRIWRVSEKAPLPV